MTKDYHKLLEHEFNIGSIIIDHPEIYGVMQLIGMETSNTCKNFFEDRSSLSSLLDSYILFGNQNNSSFTIKNEFCIKLIPLYYNNIVIESVMKRERNTYRVLTKYGFWVQVND